MLTHVPTKELLTTQELATLLSLKLQTVYNWRNRGISLPPEFNIPHTKGKRYLLKDVLIWAESLKAPLRGRGRPRKTQA